jgi:hypothetical protein
MSAANTRLNIKMPLLGQAVPVLAILMEVFWSFAWLVWLSSISALGWAHPPLNFISSIFLAVFCEIFSRYALSRKWSIKRVRLVVLLVSLVLLLLLVRLNLGGGYSIWDPAWTGYIIEHIPETVVALLAGVYLLWRGFAIGGARNTFRDIYNHFLVGLSATIVLLILWGITAGNIRTIGSSAGLYTILFFGTGLLTLAIANLEALRTELLLHQEAAGSFSRRWMTLLVALVLVILGIGIAIASFFSSDLAGTVLHALGTFADWLLTGLLYLLYPIAFVASGIYYLFKWIISLITHGQPPDQMQPMNMGDLQKFTQGQSAIAIPGGILLALKWLMILAIAGLIIYFLYRIIVRYTQVKNQEDIEEVQETLWSWGLFSADLRALLAWLFRWARRKERSKASTSSSEFTAPVIDEESGRIYSVRELYRAWLWQAGQRWSPRRRSETPYEYQRRLGANLDIVGKDVDTLTDEYIKERYGEEKTGEERLNLLNRLWHSLRARLSHPDPEE